MSGMNIAFFGSSLVSAYWNGAATYYRGIIRALADRGHRVTFYESDAFDRQKQRDIPDPEWAEVVVYSSRRTDELKHCLDRAADADLIVKASGNGVFDELLEQAVVAMKRPGKLVAFWDVDAPATLDRLHDHPSDPFASLIRQFDLILTYGGGSPVTSAYEALGARRCVAIYNAVDPATHHPVAPDPRFEADLALLANRLPDREARAGAFFFVPAESLPDKRFLLGGNGWDDKPRSGNISYIGHVSTRDHNAFNCTPTAVLNINRDSMARYGYSPATRVFEAAGAGACVITDAFEGVEMFFEPQTEILVAQDGAEVADYVRQFSRASAAEIGRRALRRALAEHTYARRVDLLENVLGVSRPVAAQAPADSQPMVSHAL